MPPCVNSTLFVNNRVARDKTRILGRKRQQIICRLLSTGAWRSGRTSPLSHFSPALPEPLELCNVPQWRVEPFFFLSSNLLYATTPTPLMDILAPTFLFSFFYYFFRLNVLFSFINVEFRRVYLLKLVKIVCLKKNF